MGKEPDAVLHYAELVLEIVIKDMFMIKLRAQMGDELTLQRQPYAINDGPPVHSLAGIFLGNILKACTDKIYCVKEGAVSIKKVAVI